MTEQIELRGPSRRSLVRATAWSVPAVSLAVQAPAHASASGAPRLTFTPGNSGVYQDDAGRWQFFFAGASAAIDGLDLQAGELVLTVTFVPDPTFSANNLQVLAGGPSGFTQQYAGAAVAIPYAYNAKVTGGSTVPISDGHWFGTFSPTMVGRFVLTLSAPGVSAVTYSVRVPTGARLMFNPGSTFVSAVPDPFNRGFNVLGLTFQGASVLVAGGTIAAQGLKMTVTFLPDTGYTDNRMLYYVDNNSLAPAGWSTSNFLANPRTAIDYLYGSTVSSGAHDVTVPIGNGNFFSTWLSSTQQQGTFLLTFTAPGFSPTTYRVHAPAAPQLRFNPGTSYVTQTGAPPGTWRLVFQGASITVAGKNLSPFNLSMGVAFEPDPGAPGQHSFAVLPGGPTGWTQNSSTTVQEATLFYYLSSVTAATTPQAVPISDGSWFQTAREDTVQYGYIVLTFQAPGCQSTTWRIHVPT